MEPRLSGDRWIFLLHAFLGAGKTNLQQAGAKRALAGDEGRTTGGTTVLAVGIREPDSFIHESR